MWIKKNVGTLTLEELADSYNFASKFPPPKKIKLNSIKGNLIECISKNTKKTRIEP